MAGTDRTGTAARKRRLAPVTALALVAALGPLAALGLVTAHAPGAAAEPVGDVNQVRSQVRDLQHEAESASERYNQARVDLKQVTAELGSIRAKVARQREAQAQAKQDVENLARSLYMSGTIDPTLQVLLTDDPAAFLAQSSALDFLAQSQQDLLRRWQTTNLRLAQAEAELTDQQERAKALTSDMKAANVEAQAKLDSAQGLLANLTQAQREELERQRQRERRQQAREARQAAQEAEREAGGANAGSSKPDKDKTPASIVPVSGKAAAVVQFALSQVGKSYRAARTGPDSYDCSGLVLAAYRKVGVSLTHYSRAQFSQTKRVSMSQMKPGDLVFYFGRGAHHVAIYVGKGKMVSASNPDDGVELIDFLGPWYRERFSGVGRVL